MSWLLQVAGVRVEHGQLVTDGADHARVAVAHVRHIVVRVDETVCRIVVQVLFVAADDVEWVRAVRHAYVAADVRVTRCRDCRLRYLMRELLHPNPKDQVRIGTEAFPNTPLARANDAVHVARDVKEVGDQLDVDVRPPVAVGGCAADAGEHRALRDRLSDPESLERVARQVPVQ